MKAQQYRAIIGLRDVKQVFSRLKDTCTLLKSGLLKEASCFPEKPRKNKLKRGTSLFWYLFRYGEILWQYNLYGLDVKPFKAMKEYIGNKELLWREYKYNVLYPKDDYTTILKDKKLFYLFLSANGFRTPVVYAYSENGLIYPIGWRHEVNASSLKGYQAISIDEMLKKQGKYFCKPTCGLCGRGIFVLDINEGKIKINGKAFQTADAVDFLSSAFKDDYVIQEMLVQHHAMSALHPQSVNTMRIITAKNKKTKEIEFVTGFLRIGGGNSNADNMAGGGMAVGIDFETGCLKHYGYIFNNGKSERIERHPTLNVCFDTIHIPHLREAIETSIELHKRLNNLCFIGWDVAITEDGVAYIEGNNSPGLSQSNHGPMRSVIDKYI